MFNSYTNCGIAINSFLPMVTLLLFLSIQIHAAELDTPGVTVKFERGDIIFNAQSASVKDIINQCSIIFKIEFTGLEQENNQKITLHFAGKSTEAFLRRLFQYLGENNFAFEYVGSKLTHVHVFSKSTEIVSDNIKNNKIYSEFSIHKVWAIKVIHVIEGSQAEQYGLKKNDYIIEYDKKRIFNASSLQRIVIENANRSKIEMTVIREGKLVPLFLNGGFIGVEITTVLIPRKELFGD